VARSHIKLWWGDLVISSRTSRHREEQNGEVPAFMASRLLTSRTLWIAILTAQLMLAMWAMRPWLTGDSSVYLELSRSLASGYYGITSGGVFQPDALRPPGYPAILALWRWLPIWSLIIFQLALYGLSIFLLDRFLIRDGAARIAFRLLALIYPFAALYSATVMGEAYAALALTIIAILMARKQISPTGLLFVGIASGVAALIRSDMLLTPVLATAIAFSRGIKPSLASIPILVAGLILLPYGAWNYANFGRFSLTPLAAAVGSSLYGATWQEKLTLADLNSMYSGRWTTGAIDSGLVDEVARTNQKFGAPPTAAPFNPATYPTNAQRIASTSVYRDLAIERIKHDPVAYLVHVFKNVFTLWNSSSYPLPQPAAAGLALVSGVVWLFGMSGAMLALVRRQRIGAAACFMLYPMLVHLPLHNEARYTAAARGLLLMFASLMLIECGRLLSGWKKQGRLTLGVERIEPHGRVRREGSGLLGGSKS
jgi:hypothetical protein